MSCRRRSVLSPCWEGGEAELTPSSSLSCHMKCIDNKLLLSLIWNPCFFSLSLVIISWDSQDLREKKWWEQGKEMRGKNKSSLKSVGSSFFVINFTAADVSNEWMHKKRRERERDEERKLMWVKFVSKSSPSIRFSRHEYTCKCIEIYSAMHICLPSRTIHLLKENKSIQPSTKKHVSHIHTVTGIALHEIYYFSIYFPPTFFSRKAMTIISGNVPVRDPKIYSWNLILPLLAIFPFCQFWFDPQQCDWLHNVMSTTAQWDR